MDLRAASRRVGIVAAVVTVVALVAPYAVITGPEYTSQLATYYASGVVGWGGIALFALLSAVVIASVERGELGAGGRAEPGVPRPPLAGVARAGRRRAVGPPAALRRGVRPRAADVAPAGAVLRYPRSRRPPNERPLCRTRIL